ncbi:MAG: endolytic transglycosylase MltG [Deltaproteobacteria bacterium]|nr:endolytic transglycosylase MltG [Deltaproteobacteria bacterium]
MRKRLETLTLIAAVVITLAGIHLYVAYLAPMSRTGAIKLITVPRGASFRQVASNLEDAGIVRDSESLIYLAWLFGSYKKIQAGEYELSASMTPMDVLDTLVKGRVKTYPVVIPEGYNIDEIGRTLKEAGLADAKQFIGRARDRGLAASLGLPGSSLEGYLFPDTYQLTKGMSVEEIIVKMADRFKSVYYKEYEPMARQNGVNMKTVVTLASIIEKETGAPGERRLISAVFQNRLKKGIRLQSDPTVIYAIKNFDGNLTKRHLLQKTPYNTYVNYGLPPGPIANPGSESIRAALDPAPEGYLYFVSKNDGTHYFSKNLKEHNNAVNRYQKKMVFFR